MARCTSATLSAWRSRLSCVTRAPSCSGTSWIHVSRGSERARIACGRVFVSTGMARGGNARALGNARGTHAAATAAESGAALDAGGADAAGSSIADARSEKADGPMKKETCMQSLSTPNGGRSLPEPSTAKTRSSDGFGCKDEHAGAT